MRGYAEALWGAWKRSTKPEQLDTNNHFLTERDGAVVGCIAETWHADHLFIEKLYVDTPFQGQGIGAAVLRMKTDQAAARHLPTILSVLTTNPADAFYRREGFTVASETPERRRMVKAI
ncbi:MAG: GNAT family N-acetyltransferase [Aliihoeflea sp.]